MISVLSGGDLVGLVTANTFLCWVEQATHTTPDGVLTPYLEMLVLLAPVVSLVGVQSVGAPAAQVQLGWWQPSVHEKHLPHGDVVLPEAESLGREHWGMSIHLIEGEVERIALQHYLEPPQIWVEEDHPIPLFLSEVLQYCHRVLVLREDVFTDKIRPYLQV